MISANNVRAQRLSASSNSSPMDRECEQILPLRVLNAFRHLRIHHWLDCSFRLSKINSAQRLSASSNSSPCVKAVQVCPPLVLNAFRHLRIHHQIFNCRHNPPIVCSTPFGIFEFITKRSAAQLTGRWVLNAFRHLRIHHSRRCSHHGITGQVLNAFRHLRIHHCKKFTYQSGTQKCSTPFGIFEFITPRVFHDLAITPQVLNAFRHLRIHHSLASPSFTAF